MFLSVFIDYIGQNKNCGIVCDVWLQYCDVWLQNVSDFLSYSSDVKQH